MTKTNSKQSDDSGDLFGTWSRERRFEYFMDIGDLEEAKRYAAGAVAGQGGLFEKRAHEHTGMVVGFIASGGGAEIMPMHEIPVDKSLVNSSVKVTLDKFHVHCYPGWGKHSILCEFNGKSQAADNAEELAMAARFEAFDKGGPALSGAKIFIGLNVGSDGISFKGRTVNVQNSVDEVVLKVLDSPAFKSGLTLLHTSQPALKPLTGLATAVVDSSIKRKKNAEVFKFELGLDFDGSPTSARLGLGSYIVVQTDDANAWNWKNYDWNQEGATIRHRSSPTDPVPYNYMVFGVSSTTASAPAAKTGRKKT